MNKTPIPFVLVDGSVLTNGMRVLVDGIDIDQFVKNPVMFYYHNDYQLPIGKWGNIRKEAGQVLADAIFDYEDDDKEVQRLIKKVEGGFVRMASISLVDLELSDDPLYRIEKQTDYTVIKSRAREASIAPIGRNHNAFRLYDTQGNEIDLASKKDRALKLADFIVKPHTKVMNKEYLKILNLSDDASDEMVEAAILKMADDKKNADLKVLDLSDKLTREETLSGGLKAKLDAIELADKTAKKQAFELELADAFKDGRLTEKADGTVKAEMLKLYDAGGESAMTMLQSMAKRKPASMGLSDQSSGGDGPWEKRQREIDQNANK